MVFESRSVKAEQKTQSDEKTWPQKSETEISLLVHDYQLWEPLVYTGEINSLYNKFSNTGDEIQGKQSKVTKIWVIN